LPVAERLLGVLTLSIALVGCQTTKVSERQKPATDNPARAKTEANRSNSSSEPVTSQSIFKDLFPNAAAKEQNAECFRSLTPEMSMYAVVQKCGRPDEEIGSGVYIFVYHLHDGSTVSIGTPYLTRIDHVSFTDPLGRTSSLLERK